VTSEIFFSICLISLEVWGLFVLSLLVHTKYHLNHSIRLQVSGLIKVLSSVMLPDDPQ